MNPRILVIRRNRMGDMIYTLPLLHAVRRHYPKAHLTVACDPPGEPIALACPAVNDVIVLEPGWNPWQAPFQNAARLQDYDWVIAAKGGFDRRLALLTRLTNAAVRIGFERRAGRPSAYYTDPVAIPGDKREEHQIETLLRLLKPLGLVKMTSFTADLSPRRLTSTSDYIKSQQPASVAVNLGLRLPASALEFAAEILAKPPFTPPHPFMLINISSTVPLKFREDDFISLAKHVLSSTDFVIGLVAAPADQQLARELALCLDSRRIAAVETPGPLDLAALLEHATLLLTPDGGAAHLAAAMDRPALVLWSEGPFKKWRSRSPKHVFVHAQPGENTIPVERVWNALQPLLTAQKDGVEKNWEELLEQPSESDFMED